MAQTVFFSWQVDTSTKSGRNFLKDAIQEACESIAEQTTVDEAPRDLTVDSDTQNVAGQPPIVPTILKKIDACAVFVADMTFVGSRKDGRLTPNPNVLVEYGWALKSIGHERVISVMNATHGKPTEKDLPFNLRHVRWPITYDLPDTADAAIRSQEKKALVAILAKAIRASLLTLPVASVISSNKTVITDVIRQNPADKIIHLRKHLTDFLGRLESLQPKMHRDGGTATDLITAIASTESEALAFAELAETVALMNDMTVAQEIFQWFGKILSKYQPPANEAGRISNADGDFFKFIGNELFTMFIMFFLREGKLDQLRELLNGALRVAPQEHRTEPTKESWRELSEHLALLADESTRTRRISVHDDLIRTRHSDGALAQIAPLRDYQDADFFLFLHGPGVTKQKYGSNWYPRSILLAKHTPLFVLEAKDYPYAMRICRTLQIGDTEELKRRLSSSKQTLQYDWQSPISDEDIEAIGSEGGAKIIT